MIGEVDKFDVLHEGSKCVSTFTFKLVERTINTIIASEM